MHNNKVQPTSLRLPAHLKSQLKQRATSNRRSMTGEIISILERVVASDMKAAE